MDGAEITNLTEYTFENVSSNHTISAMFAVNMYELTLNVVGNGTVTQSPVMTMYPHGSFVEFSVVAAPHWKFTGWIGSLSGNNTNAGVIMNEPKIVTVTFEQLFPAYSSSVASVNFDTVVYGANKMNDIVITNAGTDTLFLSEITTDNSAFTVFTNNNFILPEQELLLQIEFNGNTQGINSGTLLITHNAGNSPSIISLTGVVVDVMKFRTITASTLLAGRPANLKKNKLGILPLPNVANIRDTIMKRSSGIVVGVQQGSFDSMKIYGWLEWKKGADIGKFFTSSHTGRSYPFDSIRLDGKKTKKLSRSFKADRKKYNNPLAEQFTAFKLNLIGSDYGTLPTGLRDVQLDEAGNIFNGMTLGEIEDSLDYALTYWNREPLLLDSARAEEIKNVLSNINSAFAIDIHDSTDVASNSPLVLIGKKQIAEVTFLKRTSPRTNNSIVFRENEMEPQGYVLQQNYPNPFNPVTTIGFSLSNDGVISLRVYDVLGREVAVLINNATMNQGMYEVKFDANTLSSGVYFYRMNVNDGEYQITKKLLLMK